ncbi:hypothetical protein [Spongorhabdus nitratireducens]
MNMVLIFTLNSMIHPAVAGNAPSGAPKANLYVKQISGRRMGAAAASRNVAQEVYLLHSPEMSKLLHILAEKKVLSSTLGTGVNLVIITDKPTATIEDTIRPFLSGYFLQLVDPDQMGRGSYIDDLSYIKQRTHLFNYHQGSKLSNIPKAFAQDYEFNELPQSVYVSRPFGIEGEDRFFEDTIEPWSVVDGGLFSANQTRVVPGPGQVYYFDKSAEQCELADLQGFCGVCTTDGGKLEAMMKLIRFKLELDDFS